MDNNTVAGTSSETTNTIAVTGRVQGDSGRLLAGATLSLRPEGYLADTSTALAKVSVSRADLRTDSLGRFRIDSVDPGAYVLVVRDGAGNSRMERIKLLGDAPEWDASSLMLEPDGAITGRIIVPPGHASRAYVQIVGLEKAVRIDNDSGSYRIEGVPAGTQRLRISSASPALAPEFVTLEVTAGQTQDAGTVGLASFAEEDYSRWPHARNIQVNPSAITGANALAAPVENLPLLVRLDSSRIDFDSTSPASLRFADEAGNHLPYEVQSWDPVNRTAEVWVLSKSIPAGAATYSITLYSGLAGAHDWSSPASVFGSAAGFAGAWHLDEDAPGTGLQDLYQDASDGGNTGEDHILTASLPGIAGRSQNFLGGDYIRFPFTGAALHPEYTVYMEAWVKTDRTDLLGGTVVSTGDNFGFRLNPDGEVQFFIANTTDAWARLITSGAHITDGQWHHIACQLDAKKMFIFVDGRQAAQSAYAGKINYPFGPYFFIGTHGNKKPNYDFLGLIDEVRVATQARTADWIRLMYQSEKPGSDLLQFQ